MISKHGEQAIIDKVNTLLSKLPDPVTGDVTADANVTVEETVEESVVAEDESVADDGN